MRHEALPLRLGNDVVDLQHPRIRPGRDHARLMRRILTPEEHRWVASGSPGWELRLWAAWAAKECGFKVACKWPGPRPVFRHADFATRLEMRKVSEGFHELRGEVDTLGRSIEVSGWATESFVHLGGTGGPSGSLSPGFQMELGVERLPESGPESATRAERESGSAPDEVLESLRARFSDREWAGIHSLESAWARLVARTRLASHLQLSGSEGRDGSRSSNRSGNSNGSGEFEPHRRLEIVTSAEHPGRTPPRILLDGEELPGVDLSISHHGRYVGWALLLPSD